MKAEGRWQMADGRRQMADGRWQMADGRWQMADGRWQMADGRWQMAEVIRRRRFRGSSFGSIFDETLTPKAFSNSSLGLLQPQE